jgi:hypothetical protein
LASAIVLTALQYRQEPIRTATHAYIPIRTLLPLEAAALLSAEEGRDSEKYIGTIIQSVTDNYVILLTSWYVVPIPSSNEVVPENYNVVQILGKSYSLVSNSWENYVCRYEISRTPLEQIIGHQLLPTPQTEVSQSRFNKDKISFSSDLIWIYIVFEIFLLSSIFVLVFFLLTRINFLLWLPCFAAINFSLFFIVSFYSPAFLDADWFHQRIVIEDIVLLISYPFMVSGPISTYLIALSLGVFFLYKTGAILKNRKILTLAQYVFIVSAILVIALTSGIGVLYMQYSKASKDVERIIGNVQKTLSKTKTRSLVRYIAEHSTVMHENFFKNNNFSEDNMHYITTILAARSQGDPELTVLIPIKHQYIYLSKNDHFSYGDTRHLRNANASIIDYEYIEPAINSKGQYRTSFLIYVFNFMQMKYTRYIEVVTDHDNGSLMSVVIASTH